jgi:hypothetical protein
MKRSDMPYEFDFNDQQNLGRTCRCGHVDLIHGRAAWSCNATGCRCKEFHEAVSQGMHVVRCKQGHTDIDLKGRCRKCNAARVALYRARKKAKKAEVVIPPGTFDYKGERFEEGGTWKMLRKHGWMQPERKQAPAYCSIHGCEELSITVPLCAEHTPRR